MSAQELAQRVDATSIRVGPYRRGAGWEIEMQWVITWNCEPNPSGRILEEER